MTFLNILGLFAFLQCYLHKIASSVPLLFSFVAISNALLRYFTTWFDACAEKLLAFGVGVGHTCFISKTSHAAWFSLQLFYFKEAIIRFHFIIYFAE